jgi:hypothetical protein
MKDALAWLEGYRKFWEERFDSLEEILKNPKNKKEAP